MAVSTQTDSNLLGPLTLFFSYLAVFVVGLWLRSESQCTHCIKTEKLSPLFACVCQYVSSLNVFVRLFSFYLNLALYLAFILLSPSILARLVYVYLSVCLVQLFCLYLPRQSPP